LRSFFVAAEEAQKEEAAYTEDEGQTYSIQYMYNELKDLELYQKNFALDLQAEHTALFKDKFVAFRTLLEIIE
jgi:hypothetical protein